MHGSATAKLARRLYNLVPSPHAGPPDAHPVPGTRESVAPPPMLLLLPLLLLPSLCSPCPNSDSCNCNCNDCSNSNQEVVCMLSIVSVASTLSWDTYRVV